MQEKDIRPAAIHDEYLRLSAQDIKRYFKPGAWNEIPCPGCEQKETQFSFEKNQFGYRECLDCGTLFQSPRPPIAAFDDFYSVSESSQYWARVFFPTVVESRRQLIFQPRVRRIHELCIKRGLDPKMVLDVGAGYGLFLEEWKNLVGKGQACAIEPHPELAEGIRSKGFEVLQATSETATEWHSKGDLVTCFEVIEHAHSPIEFVKSLFNLVRPGGYVVVSGLGVDGFDIQVMWEKSKGVSPPHHLNFLSVKGFEKLFARAGFDNVEVLTPGVLDVDIVNNYFNQDGELPRFIATLLSRGEQARKDFQEFLAKHRLSSHTWIMGRRPTGGN